MRKNGGDNVYSYKTTGTCSTEIILVIKDEVIHACTFEKGCRGNTEGLCRLAVGRRVDEVIDLVKGIECRNGTSCPDQLALALEQWKQENT